VGRHFARAAETRSRWDELAREAFTIDDYPGVGYLFAVASADPFVYDQTKRTALGLSVIADGRVRGDPYWLLTDLAQPYSYRTGYVDWDYDVIRYNVGQHYDYPRFLCYDCHTYVSYPTGILFSTHACASACSCTTIPGTIRTATYGGSRVVFVAALPSPACFIFKDWGADRPSREASSLANASAGQRQHASRSDGPGFGGPRQRAAAQRAGPSRSPGMAANNGGNDHGNNGNDRGNNGNDHGNRRQRDRGNRGNDNRGNRGNDNRGNVVVVAMARRAASLQTGQWCLPPADQPRVQPLGAKNPRHRAEVGATS